MPLFESTVGLTKHSLNPILSGISSCFSPCCDILNVAGVYKKIVLNPQSGKKGVNYFGDAP